MASRTRLAFAALFAIAAGAMALRRRGTPVPAGRGVWQPVEH